MSYDNFDPVNSDITTFRSSMSNIQPPNTYMATFSFGQGKNESIITYPDSIQLPERGIQTLEYSPWGYPTQIPVHGSSGTMLMTFIILADWDIPNFFEHWLERIQSRSMFGNISLPVSSYDESFGSCTISFYKNRALTKRYSAEEVYPISIPPIEFSSYSTGYANFGVLFYVRNLSVDFDQSTHLNAIIGQRQSLPTPPTPQ